MGLINRLNAMANSCGDSIGMYAIEGYNGQKYLFCLHEIEILDTDIDITQHKNWNPNRTLNDYGNEIFCKFRINNHLTDKGLYCLVVNNELIPRYIGRVKGSYTYGKRFNSGYGHISPYNCYKSETINGKKHSGGQSTNCHINSFINKTHRRQDIKVGFLVMNNQPDKIICDLEDELIKTNDPELNRR